MKLGITMALLYGATAMVGLFWYAKYQLKNNEYEELLERSKEEKITPKERTVLMLIADKIQSYRKGENGFTVLRKISDLIISLDEKKEDISTPNQDKC